MDTFDIAEAKEKLAELIERAKRGEDVRISDAKGSAIRLIPAEGPPLPKCRLVFGQWKHLAEIPEERLLAPLSEQELGWLSGENAPAE